MKTAFILNGPNLNLLGTREPQVYGSQTLDDVRLLCERACAANGFAMDFRQSNHEGVLVDWIQEARLNSDALVINAAGLSYSSVPILDALLAFGGPIIEAHMSNIWKRESFRHHSYVSKAATGVVAGLGALGYQLALTAVAELLTEPQQ